jgi:MFS family permease
VLLMTGALLGDRFGRRRMFVAGLALFTAASAACALSPSIGALIAARTAQGAGAALVMPLSLTLLSTSFPARQRGAALGIFSGLTGLGTLSGPFIGGALAQGLAWQWIFWFNVPIGLIAIVLVLGRIEESHGPEGRLDLGGLGLVTGGALGLVWGLVRGNGAGWGSAEVIGALAAGAALMVAFVAWELRNPTPSCRCGSSSPARSRPPTWRTSASTPRCTARCSSWPSTCRPRSATDRSAPAFGCCP